ncbi:MULTISPECIES: YeeE/YedE family protein [Methylobacillus]|uniref:Uncharacterized protein n=1 Tax=Methylobacillus flagellatus (strain ATCC 51484 / DSM 6875 / VKM B-1610 / KT) TaxID=265072 RepID=Q1H0A9_METFK|nr:MULTISPECIES: YeeE/YedE family protein [Methylobacillus]ABE50078.1 protein of unknown function DUF395, YeeE/YedE [Methylobacillus flagellatus KT]MPS48687.1 YeeE/YedE family protein [Methylobacillus sp.]
MVTWAHITPLESLAGGVLIGLAAALLLIMNGRIAGISGILGGLLNASWSANAWRLCFLAGLVGSPWLYSLWSAMPEATAPRDIHVLVLAGILVGFGTRLGSGCTSGHGVCGMARLSPRSMIATLVFMAAAMLTVSIYPPW